MDSEIQRQLECPVCLCQFTTPKVLPCQHTFCLQCLERSYSSNGEGNIISCPECRAEHPIPRGGISGFPTNITAQRLMEAMTAPNVPQQQPTAPTVQPTTTTLQPIRNDTNTTVNSQQNSNLDELDIARIVSLIDHQRELETNVQRNHRPERSSGLWTTDESQRNVNNIQNTRQANNRYSLQHAGRRPRTTEESQRNVNDRQNNRRANNRYSLQHAGRRPRTTEESHRNVNDRQNNRRANNRYLPRYAGRSIPWTTDESQRNVNDIQNNRRANNRYLQWFTGRSLRTTEESQRSVNDRQNEGQTGNRNTQRDNHCGGCKISLRQFLECVLIENNLIWISIVHQLGYMIISRLITSAVKLNSGCKDEYNVARYMFVKSWFDLLFFSAITWLIMNKKVLKHVCVQIWMFLQLLFFVIWLSFGSIWIFGNYKKMTEECPLYVEDWDCHFINFAIYLTSMDWFTVCVFVFQSLVFFCCWDKDDISNSEVSL